MAFMVPGISPIVPGAATPPIIEYGSGTLPTGAGVEVSGAGIPFVITVDMPPIRAGAGIGAGVPPIIPTSGIGAGAGIDEIEAGVGIRGIGARAGMGAIGGGAGGILEGWLIIDEIPPIIPLGAMPMEVLICGVSTGVFTPFSWVMNSNTSFSCEGDNLESKVEI